MFKMKKYLISHLSHPLNGFLGIVLAFLTLPTLFSGEITFGSNSPNTFQDLKRTKLSVVKVGAKEDKLELSKTKFKNAELFLDFENKKPSDLRDKSNNYDVRESVYTPIEGESLFGKRYASFTTKESQLRIYSGTGKILSDSVLSIPLYFSFYIMPGDLEQSSNVFSKSYLTSGKKYGIECKIINNKIEVAFHNFFSFKESETKTFYLQSPDKLNSKVWSHIMITLEPTEGLAKLYENGILKTSFQAIRSSTDSTPLLSGFHVNDTNPLVIGKDFYGKLDNFMIGKGSIPDVTKMSIPYSDVSYENEVKVATHSRGMAVSKVIKTKYSHSQPTKLEYRAVQPQGTHLELHYRFSEEPFEDEDSLPIWSAYDQDEFSKKEKDTYFSYFQWKIVMRSNHSGEATPSLTYLSLKFKDSIPPSPPFGLKVTTIDHSSKKVCLQWNSNHEQDVIDGGGYFIHYGVSPDRMVSTLHKGEGGKMITGISDKEESNETLKAKVKKNYRNLQYCIDNNIIDYNAEITKDKNLLHLKSGITYYFKLTAYNNKYPFNVELKSMGQDQKSLPSLPVSVTFRLDVNNGN
jgi:hypothetical protein